MKCLTCGTDMVCNIDGHCLSWKCPNCGDGIATSYFEPIELDQAEYSIIIEKVEEPVMEQIKITSQILNVNYITTRKLLIEGDAIFKGKAIPVQNSAAILNRNNLKFSITPDFPYEIQ
ncbi:MAG: hypothetical protein PUB20_04455 [Clostridia bacterium]|nr:hypothetical protein [Clostridia bacterium]